MKNNSKLKDAEAKIKAAQKLIAEQQKVIDSLKPKPVMERINGYNDVCKEYGIKPSDKLVSVNPKLFDEVDIRTLENLAKRILTVRLYNGDKKTKRNSPRYFPYYKFSSGAGLVVNGSYYSVDYACTSSAARLSFVEKEHSDDYGRKFIDDEKGIINL